MKRLIYIVCAWWLMSACDEESGGGGLVLPPGSDEVEVLSPKAVNKSNPMPVYMHYMPWFEAKGEFSSGWGYHWTMSTQNPDVIGDNNQRQIASHYYPLIGAYDSRDPDVINYHLLLMKYAGVDGLLINWYGEKGTNGDVNFLLEASNAIIDETEETGMEFAVVLEDRFAGSKEDTKANMAYLNANYYNHKQYIKMNEAPLTLLFGPITFNTSATWTEILAASTADELFMPLWYNTNKVGGANADGEYAWVYKDAIAGLTNFYNNTTEVGVKAGGAYPGFEDFYEEGGQGDIIGWEIPVSRDLLKQTLDLADTHKDKLDFLQLITWNDFGEGTNIEPTVEFEFQFLEEVQDYTGANYTVAELELIHDWYLLTKKTDLADDEEAQDEILQAFYYLVALEVEKAEELIAKHK
jgi:hypothetical protein